MPLLETPGVTTASRSCRSAVVAVFVDTQATRPPQFRTLPVISVRTAMTAPTHSLSVRPEHLPVPPDWVLRLRVGSASTQQVASPRLTPGYRADRGLPGRGPCTPLEVRVSARDVHPATLAARLGPYLFEGLPEPERAIGDRELGANRQPTPLQIEEQFPPRLRTLAHTVGEADELLPALGGSSDDDQQALRGVFETGLHVNAVDPEVDVAFGREIALAPARVLFGPGLLEASNGRSREPAGVPAEQCNQRVLEVAARDALEVEDRDQHLQALRPARVGRQNRRRKADALGTFAAAVAHARAAHSDRTDAGHDLTLGQMPVAHQPLAAIIGELVGMATEQARNLGLDSLRQQRSRAVAQNLGQRIGKSSWLGELENVSVGHGVSLLRWRSGGFEHPHDTPPYPIMPSPTFAHSSTERLKALDTNPPR